MPRFFTDAGMRFHLSTERLLDLHFTLGLYDYFNSSIRSQIVDEFLTPLVMSPLSSAYELRQALKEYLKLGNLWALSYDEELLLKYFRDQGFASANVYLKSQSDYELNKQLERVCELLAPDPTVLGTIKRKPHQVLYLSKLMSFLLCPITVTEHLNQREIHEFIKKEVGRLRAEYQVLNQPPVQPMPDLGLTITLDPASPMLFSRATWDLTETTPDLQELDPLAIPKRKRTRDCS